MLACVMASMMDNCAVQMLCFAGVFSNNIYKKFIRPDVSEKRYLLVSRLSSVVFAVASISCSYLFDDTTKAIRFLFQTIPLMGIPFFFAILWRRSNRYGMFAAFFAAVGAVVFAQFHMEWQGDPGLPKTVTLYIAAGIAAGIIVSLLTPPEPKHRLDRFYLLLKTPIGQEEILHKVGFREIPGTGTYELPPEADQDFDYDAAIRKIDFRETRKHAWYGFVLLILVVLLLIGSVTWLAGWLANG